MCSVIFERKSFPDLLRSVPVSFKRKTLSFFSTDVGDVELRRAPRKKIRLIGGIPLLLSLFDPG